MQCLQTFDIEKCSGGLLLSIRACLLICTLQVQARPVFQPLILHTWLSRWLLAKAYHDVEEVSHVVGQSKPVTQDELLIALVAIVAVQPLRLHTACTALLAIIGITVR